MKDAYTKIKTLVLAHKIISSIVILAVLLVIFNIGDDNEEGVTTYVPWRVSLGTLETSVSGTGQVVASTQLDLKTKASGDVIYIGVLSGDEVYQGQLLIQLDASDAQKAVRDAEVNLESAELALQKLLQPATELMLLQASNDLEQAKEAKNNAEDSLEKSYEEGFNTVSNAFLDLPTIMAGLEGILFDNSINSLQDNISAYQNAVDQYVDEIDAMKEGVKKTYQTARASYNVTFSLYNSLSRFSSNEEIIYLIEETYLTAQLIAEAVKTTNNYIDFVEDVLIQENQTVFSQTAGHQLSLDTYTNDSNNHLISLLNIQNAISNAQETITNSERTIAEEKISLKDLEAGTDTIDLESQKLIIKQRQNSLQDAKENLADYSVYAPISGVMALLDVFRGESLSSGASIGVLITKQQIAEITLNEVDVAFLKSGQNATLNFDAVEDLEIEGEVIEVDVVGAVNQGVVSYGVKIGFDTSDTRIKSGMSVSATIITNVKENVLLVSNSAIKIDGTRSYVEVLENVDLPDERSGRGEPEEERVELQAEFQNMSEEEREERRVQFGGQGDGTGGRFANITEGERQAIRERFQNGEGVSPQSGSSRDPSQRPIGIAGEPVQKNIVTGLSNDLFTEVVSGLNEGDIVVIQTIMSTPSYGSEGVTNSILPTGRGFGGGRR